MRFSLFYPAFETNESLNILIQSSVSCRIADYLYTYWGVLLFQSMHAFEMLINYQERSRIDDQRCDISSFIPKVRPHTGCQGITTEPLRTWYLKVFSYSPMSNTLHQMGLSLVTSAVGFQTKPWRHLTPWVFLCHRYYLPLSLHDLIPPF